MTVKVFDKGEYVEIKDMINETDACRICGKQNYIINVDNIPRKKDLGRENSIKKFGGIPVDYCIGKEVEWLINQGVITRACCCGHKQYEPHCLIVGESVNLIKELGYEPEWYSPELWKIKLYKEC
jgi:hypothetical protein